MCQCKSVRKCVSLAYVLVTYIYLCVSVCVCVCPFMCQRHSVDDGVSTSLWGSSLRISAGFLLLHGWWKRVLMVECSDQSRILLGGFSCPWAFSKWLCESVLTRFPLLLPVLGGHSPSPFPWPLPLGLLVGGKTGGHSHSLVPLGCG